MTLSPRQQQIAALFAEGLSAKGVGRRLGISRDTVWEHIERAARRLPAGEGTARERVVRFHIESQDSNAAARAHATLMWVRRQ